MPDSATLSCPCCGSASAAFNFDGNGAVLSCSQCKTAFRFSGNLIAMPSPTAIKDRPALLRQLHGSKALNAADRLVGAAERLAPGPERDRALVVARSRRDIAVQQREDDYTAAAIADGARRNDEAASPARLMTEMAARLDAAIAEIERLKKLTAPVAPAP